MFLVFLSLLLSNDVSDVFHMRLFSCQYRKEDNSLRNERETKQVKRTKVKEGSDIKQKGRERERFLSKIFCLSISILMMIFQDCLCFCLKLPLKATSDTSRVASKRNDDHHDEMRIGIGMTSLSQHH
jgi:hypothetical protein